MICKETVGNEHIYILIIGMNLGLFSSLKSLFHTIKIPKLPRRQCFNRFLIQRRSRESISRKESQESSNEEEDQMIPTKDVRTDYIDFSNESILNSSRGLFSFCAERIDT